MLPKEAMLKLLNKMLHKLILNQVVTLLNNKIMTHPKMRIWITMMELAMVLVEQVPEMPVLVDHP
jgi:hypothetical protein